MMKVLGGDWPSNQYAAFKKSLLGKPKSLIMPKGVIKSDSVELGDISSAEIVTDTDSLSRRAGWAAVGLLALGPVGLLAGAMAGKKTLVAVEFKDGRRALLECGGDETATLVGAAYSSNT